MVTGEGIARAVAQHPDDLPAISREQALSVLFLLDDQERERRPLPAVAAS